MLLRPFLNIFYLFTTLTRKKVHFPVFSETPPFFVHDALTANAPWLILRSRFPETRSRRWYSPRANATRKTGKAKKVGILGAKLFGFAEVRFLQQSISLFFEAGGARVAKRRYSVTRRTASERKGEVKENGAAMRLFQDVLVCC